MNDLLSRIEHLSGADREVDWLIAEHLGQIPAHTVREVGWDHDWFRHPGEFILVRYPGADDRAGCETWKPAPVTGSLDAITTLIERKLPGWAWYVQSIGVDPYPACSADLWIPAQRTQGLPVEAVRRAEAATAPLALCLAFLRALSNPTRSKEGG